VLATSYEAIAAAGILQWTYPGGRHTRTGRYITLTPPGRMARSHMRAISPAFIPEGRRFGSCIGRAGSLKNKGSGRKCRRNTEDLTVRRDVQHLGRERDASRTSAAHQAAQLPALGRVPLSANTAFGASRYRAGASAARRAQLLSDKRSLGAGAQRSADHLPHRLADQPTTRKKHRPRQGSASPRRGIRLPRLDLTSLIYASSHIFLRSDAAYHGARAAAICRAAIHAVHLLSSLAIFAVHARHHAEYRDCSSDADGSGLCCSTASSSTSALKDRAVFRESPDSTLPLRRHRLDWLMFGEGRRSPSTLVVQIGEQVDFLRLLTEKTRRNRDAWWAAGSSQGRLDRDGDLIVDQRRRVPRFRPPGAGCPLDKASSRRRGKSRA